MVRKPHIARVSRGIPLAGTTFVLGLVAGTLVGPGLPAPADPASAALAEPAVIVNTRHPMAGSHPADVLRVIDGDTFEARVRVWPGIEITTKVRLRGIDAPELKARCSEERSKAEAAREGLRAMLADGDIAITRVSLDKYGGRVVADAATRATADISAAMLAQGLARPYGGGRRESWCSGL
jgi:endonuclease YncB( thermonuclease family)